MATSKLTMKLLIDTKSERVIYAEAGKECVDFLFHILALPMGNVIRLLTTEGMVGSLGNLYESLENLDNVYIQPNQNKDVLLKPNSPSCIASVPLLFLTNSPSSVERNFYCCSDCETCDTYNVSDDPRAICPLCNGSMSTELDYVAPPAQNMVVYNGGMVKEAVIYLVLDNLVVKPMSTISSITLLSELNINDVGVLQEKVINLGMNEALKLLKTSLQSKNVLTDVFMGIIKD